MYNLLLFVISGILTLVKMDTTEPTKGATDLDTLKAAAREVS